MSSDSKPKTTADLFRERGWGVGTKMVLSDRCDVPYFEIDGIGRTVVSAYAKGSVHPVLFWSVVNGWSLYTPTPPIPTREEWEELWAALQTIVASTRWVGFIGGCKEAEDAVACILKHAAKLDAPQ